ncbi:MmgE/PrpD family protein [Chloroflexota bacterium]
MGQTRALVDWIMKASYDDFDDETLDYTKRLLLKAIAGMVVGSKEAVGVNISNYLSEAGGSPEAGVIGRGFKTSVENAALANGTFSHASELEDDRFPGPIGTYWIFPAFFGLGEKLGSSGKEIIEATIVSWEATWRMARAAPSWLMVGKGIVPNAWFGAVATAAGAARLLKLTNDQAQHAMSIAASQASGLVCQLGWDAHFIESGHSCRAGVLSAYLAKAGATGRPDFLEVNSGLFGPVWDMGQVDLDSITDGLGKPPWDINNVWIKKFPCCYGNHMPIDALTMLMQENNIRYEDVEGVETEVDQMVGNMDDTGCNRPFPDSLGGARFSLHYTLGQVLLRGKVDLSFFTDEEKLSDPDLKEAQAKIKVIVPPEWGTGHVTRGRDLFAYGASVTIVKKDGQRLKKHLDYPIGHPTDSPLSFAQVREICRPFVDDIIGEKQGNEIVQMIIDLEKQADIREMMNILTFSGVEQATSSEKR